MTSPLHSTIHTATKTVTHPVTLYNTMTRSVEPLRPITQGLVKLYCCGPTVYNFQHIGNLRTYIFEDLLVRTLRYAGYKVQHVMNITDVGHLVSDADEGEDKMALAAKREGKTSLEIAAYYTKIFLDHCKLLNISTPDIVCKATEHIEQMIALIAQLETQGFAYKSGGNVYFDVSKLPDYGKLARLDLAALQAGARIDVDSNKKHPLDFALWFTKSKFENQELQWDSPWGKGYPGWHIECSAMAMKYLGEHFDIHCGGIDHIPVHHTNEIAQSEGATGKPFVNIWMHGGFLVANAGKMSKSTGDFLTLDLVQEKGIDPASYRFFCLGTSYRQELNWSWEAIENAARGLKKIKAHYLELKRKTSKASSPENFSSSAERLLKEFRSAVFSDLGIPKALATLHRISTEPEISAEEKLGLFHEFDQILGLGVSEWVDTEVSIPNEVSTLAKLRVIAKKEKNWGEADRLRDQILALGFIVEDSADGFRLKGK